jgi:hypothetical protein
MIGPKFKILLCLVIIILAVSMTFLMWMTGSYGAQVHETSEKTTGSTITTIFPMITSHDILAKILIDNAIQAIQDGNRNMTIRALLVANQELASVIESEHSSLAIEPKFIVEYLLQLMQNGTGGVTNNKALVYLNLADSQLGDMLNEPNTDIYRCT